MNDIADSFEVSLLHDPISDELEDMLLSDKNIHSADTLDECHVHAILKDEFDASNDDVCVEQIDEDILSELANMDSSDSQERTDNGKRKSNIISDLGEHADCASVVTANAQSEAEVENDIHVSSCDPPTHDPCIRSVSPDLTTVFPVRVEQDADFEFKRRMNRLINLRERTEGTHRHHLQSSRACSDKTLSMKCSAGCVSDPGDPIIPESRQSKRQRVSL